MIKRLNEETITRWLAAEAAGRDEAAEAALAELFAGLPGPAPAAGFAARVLERVAPEGDPFARSPWRWLIAACLLVGALTAGLGSGIAGKLIQTLRGASVGGVIEGLTDGLITAARALAEFVALVGRAADLGRLVEAVAEAPPVVATLAAAVLISATAFRLLYGLIERERSYSHVETIR